MVARKFTHCANKQCRKPLREGARWAYCCTSCQCRESDRQIQAVDRWLDELVAAENKPRFERLQEVTE